MPKFMLILHRSPEVPLDLSPEEIQQSIEGFRAWLAEIQSNGRYVVSDKLAEEGGRIVSLQAGKPVVVDGPYSESKEVIGGYFTIRAADYDEAVEIVKHCPFLATGRISIRQTDPMGCGGE
jgi:hypothetical protein